MAVQERIGAGGLDLGLSPGDMSAPVPPNLLVDVERADATVLLGLSGELDAATHALVVDAADAALDGVCRDLIISCAGLSFVDSSGLRALLAVRGACAGTETRFHLVETSPFLDQLLDATGLRSAFGQPARTGR